MGTIHPNENKLIIHLLPICVKSVKIKNQAQESQELGLGE